MNRSVNLVTGAAIAFESALFAFAGATDLWGERTWNWPAQSVFGALLILAARAHIVSRTRPARSVRGPESGATPAVDASELKYPVISRLVNGVFQGGGAKGVVYIGALHELRARGIWFESVAGSSAGAVLAMLIALGFPPAQMFEHASAALPTVKPNVFSWLRRRERAVFRVGDLRTWLEDRLKERTSVVGREVTFADINAEAGFIELNVVAMDLATREPIVFSRNLTPQVSVAEAVIASSAIPIAMPPSRIVVRKNGRTSVHRVVDGGTWANYPAFVYRDSSFRAAAGLAALPKPNTLGFVINAGTFGQDEQGDPESLPWPPPAPRATDPRPEAMWNVDPAPTRFDAGGGRLLGWLGALLTWSALRWIVVLIALPAAAAGLWLAHLQISEQYRSHGGGDFGGGGSVGTWDDPILSIALTSAWLLVEAAIALGLVATMFLIAAVARFGAEIADVGVPSALAAMSIGPRVPSWVGYDVSVDQVIRLSAPVGINTTSFRAPYELRRLAVVVAAHQANSRMDELFGAQQVDAAASIAPLSAVIPSPAPDTSDEMQYARALEAARRSERNPAWTDVAWAVAWLAFAAGLPLIVPDILRLGEFKVDPTWYLPFLIIMSSASLAIMLQGRTRKLDMANGIPRVQHWIPRLALGFVCVTGGALLTIPGAALLSLLAVVFTVFGALVFASGFSSLLAGDQVKRYLRELRR